MSDCLADAVAVVRSDGRIEFANRAMRQLLRRNSNARVHNLRLSPTDARDAAFSALVGEAATRGVRRFGRLVSDDVVYEVCALPLRQRDQPHGGSGFAMLLARDIATRDEIDLDYLASVFGLTITEARLTRAVCNGASVDQAAEQMTITAATVRTHLKRIYAKTGVRRQVDLVRLVTGGLHAHLSPEPPGKLSTTDLNALEV